MEIELNDHGRFIPGGRASYEILPGQDTRRTGSLLDLARGAAASPSHESEADAPAESVAPPPRKRPIAFTLSVEGALSAVEGRDRQEVVAGTRIELDEPIAGPALVEIDAESLHGHLAGRVGFRVVDMFSLEFMLGIGVDRTEVEVRSGALQYGEGGIDPGFLWGGRATFRPIPLVDFYAQSTMNLLPRNISIYDDDDDEVHSAVAHEVGMDLNVTRNVAVFSGYRWWSYSESGMSGGSDVDLDIQGPTAGLSLKF